MVGLGLLSTILGPAAAPGAAQSGSESSHLAAGNALLAAGRLKEAIPEFEAAARLSRRPAPILNGLARLYLDAEVRRPADALTVSRAARRLEPWREENYYLQARAYESLGDQEAARQTYRILLANFPAGVYRAAAERGMDRLSRSTYEVTLGFRFANRGAQKAEKIRLRVQAVRDFPPYSQARLAEIPRGGRGHELDDGTRYLSFEPFALDPGQERTFRIRYLVSVSAQAYEPAYRPSVQENLDGYLSPSPFIESDSPEIMSLSRALAPDSGPAQDRARRLYDFVLSRLSYVVQPETKGALGALANPSQADCTEFAALFIALSRAAGIPARPVFGYLYESDKATYEISHLWAEFWQDGQGWMNADPTNGSLEPNRYFGRVESNYIPLWVPHASFGDLAGVRVSYRSPGDEDTLFTELITEIRAIPYSDFEAAGGSELAFEPGAAGEGDDSGTDLPVVPAAALFAAALGLRFWQRRGRSL